MRFSNILISLCTITIVGGCAFIIPPEQNAPRNNTVLGGPRKPLLNNQSMSPQSGVQRTDDVMRVAQAAYPAASSQMNTPSAPEAPMHVATSAYTPPRSTLLGVPLPSISRTSPRLARNLPTWLGGTSEADLAAEAAARSAAEQRTMNAAMAPLPPVDAQVQVRAEQEMSLRSAMPVPAQSTTMSGRRVPVENGTFQVSANGYPDVNSVPSRPQLSGEGSAKARLTQTQSTLEADRNQAFIEKEALVRDAAAEPSMLSDLPNIDGAVPATGAIESAPIAAPAELPAAPQSALPAATMTQPMAALEPLPSMVPTRPVVSSQRIVVGASETRPAALNVPNFAPPAPRAFDSMPSSPVVVSSSEMQVRDVPPPTAMAQASARRADFDPLAVADNAPISAAPTVRQVSAPRAAYVSNRYIAPSRYADYR